MKKKVLILTAAILLLCLISACSPGASKTDTTTASSSAPTYTGPNAHKYGGILMLRFREFPRSWLLYDEARYNTNSEILNLVAAPLIRFDGKVFEPAIAEWYEVSEDNTTLTVAIKSNALWHDGTPVTADDYVFSREYMANEYWGDPSSLEAYTVNKLDDLTFEIVLAKPDEDILENYGSLHALPKHIYENITPVAAYTTDAVFPPVFNGPFKITEYTAEYIVLKPHDGFACGRPYLDEIYLRRANRQTEASVAFMAGDLDILVGQKADFMIGTNMIGGDVKYIELYTRNSGMFLGHHSHVHIEECGVTRNHAAVFMRPELLWTERR